MIDESAIETNISKSDLQKLCERVLYQIMEDYVKLQPQKLRTRSYLNETFTQAVEALFDSEFRFLYFKNGYGDEMSFPELVRESLGYDEDVDVSPLKQHVIQQALDFWETKQIRTLIIPNNLLVDGHVFQVIHSEEPDITIDWTNYCIHCNKDDMSSLNQKKFCDAVMQIVCYIHELDITTKEAEQLSASWFRVLRMNNCFLGDV